MSTFTGITQSSPLDVSGTATGTSGNPTVSATTTTANDLVLATLSRFSTTTASTNRTSLYNDVTGSTLGAASYQLATTAGSYSDTYTGSSATDWSMVLAAFKPVGSSLVTTVRYVHTDHLTGSNVVTNASNAVEETLDYYPYGSARIDSGTYSDQRKYIGQEYDADTGLNYLNARYYNSSTGRFVSQDPEFWSLNQAYLTDPQQWNSYSYGRDNPLTNSDPTGHLTRNQAANWIRGKADATYNFFDSGFISPVTNPLGITDIVGFGTGTSKRVADIIDPQASTGSRILAGAGIVADFTPVGEEASGLKGITREVKLSPSQIGKQGEKILGDLVGPGEVHKMFSTSQGKRFVDRFTGDSIHEVKNGYVTATEFVQKQIQKDAEIMKSNPGIQSTWHLLKGGSESVKNKIVEWGSKVVDYTKGKN